MKNIFFLYLFSPLFLFSQTNYYVALDIDGGNDSLNTGTINSPFNTVNKALSLMNSGDTCFMRSGVYHEEIIIDGKNNIVITPYNNEYVCFEGTHQITSNWNQYSGNIFQTTLSRHIWQLFVDNKEMVMARWPDANFIDTSIYSLDTWASGIVDSISGYPDGSYNGFQLVDTTKYNLGLTGLDLTSAIGIMNVGSFKTFNREITSHNPGDNFFNYDVVPNNAYRDKHHNFYFEGKLELLDQPNEWFYDTISKILYLYADNGQNPNGRIIKGKVQDYAINITNSSHVTISNLFFFSTTFSAKTSNNVIINNCNFSHPNCSKRMLKDFLTHPNVSVLGNSGSANFVNNSVIKKCLFEHTDGEALRVYGNNNLIENCYMRFIDYTVSELPFLMVGVYINGDSNRFIHNTIHHSSASAFIAPGTSPEFAYNEVYATGSLQSDGSVYQGTAATVENSNIHHNYIHDTPKYALRFDAPGGSPGQAGQFGKMHHNIVVRTNGIMVKGNHHYICHNTTFSSKKNGLIILDEDNSNDSSYIYNNFSEKMSAHRSNQTSIPGIHSNNWNGYDNPNTNFFTQLDTINYLPLANSSLLDSGITISTIPHQIFNTAPDIGALEFGIVPWSVGVDWFPIHFPWILGCTDINACNFDSLATVSDSSCTYPITTITIDTVCDSYTWGVNGQTYSFSVIDTVIGINANGCLETNILNLIIYTSTIFTVVDTVCNSYTWGANGVTYTSSAIDTVIGINALGCTETNILNLLINNSTSSSVNVSACDSYNWNGQTYTSSGNYTYTSLNSNGCDSVATLNLSIDSIYSITNYSSICFGDSILVGNNIYNQSGIYSDYFISSNGCDSIITTNLTVYSEIVLSLSQNGNNILADVLSGTAPYYYEWSNGEIFFSNEMTPLFNGIYWVIITDDNGCDSDTSFINVDWLPTSVIDLNLDQFNVYPNPSKDIFNIEFISLKNQDLKLKIVNSIGEIIYNENIINHKGIYNTGLNLTKHSKSIYFLEIQTERGIILKKLILQ